MSNYTKDSIVRHIARGHSGKVIGTDFAGVYVFNAASGQKASWSFSEIEPATKEEYDAQVDARMQADFQSRAPQRQGLVNPATKQPIHHSVRSKAQTFRWICLECGNKYNGRACPICGGNDHILNHGDDFDPSHVGGAPMAPYAPKD